jgi:5-methylthioadenosine/S-adenosylhomocysteine deaminase
VAAYRAAGLSVAVGTDGQGFSDTSDYLEELRLAGLLQRTPGLDTLALTPSALLEMATTAGARAFGRHDTGRLEAGAMANVVTLDAAALTHPYAWPGTDPLETLISRARASHVRTLVSRGRPLLEDGVVRTVDETAVTARLQDLYGQIWAGRSAQRYANLEALEVHVRRFFEPWAELPVRPAYTYNRT